jgi:HAD superfamily hydrolase (TIGR01549 family)
MIRAIIFDFGQTLVDSSEGFRAAEKEAQARAFQALYPTDQEEFLAVYREIRSAFHAQSRFSRKAIFAEVFRRYGRTPDLPLLEQWENEYWQRVQAVTRVFPEAEAVLRQLREKAYRLALITNAQGQEEEGQHRLANYPALERLFEVIVVAGEGGVPAKPDPAPFHLCLEMLGLDPNEAVYVGDDWRIDVRGAEAVGMRAIWLKHRLVRRNWPSAETAAPVIDSLDGLLNVEKLLKGVKK